MFEENFIDVQFKSKRGARQQALSFRHDFGERVGPMGPMVALVADCEAISIDLLGLMVNNG